MIVKSGRVENMPYSLSRWTDVPAAKWSWFLASLDAGQMMAFAQTGDILPSRWSLKPEDTLGLVFWTKDPSNVIRDRQRLSGYEVRLHVTLTGWEEVEKGAPDLDRGIHLLKQAVETFGADRVRWRFSPVPILDGYEVVYRFKRIAAAVGPLGIRQAILAFLQQNDLMPETRTWETRLNLLAQLATAGREHGVNVGLCNEDRILTRWSEYGGQGVMPEGLGAVVCAPPEDFSLAGREKGASEGCGCALMVDPFTINESCTFGCGYCYAADLALTSKKRNTTRSLPVVR